MERIKKHNKVIIWVIALLSTGAFYPAFWTSAIVGQASFIIFAATLLVWFAVLIVCSVRLKPLSTEYNALYLFLIFYYVLRLCFTMSEEYLINLAHLITFYIYTLLAYNSYADKTVIVKYFIRFHVLMLLLTIIGTVLYNMGLLYGFRFISMGENSGATLVDYGFFYAKSHTFEYYDLDYHVRPAGYYDEPGSLGLVTVLLLILNRKILNNKKYELILLFGGIVTISMAYIYSFLLFLVLFYTKGKKLKYFLAFTLVAFLFIGGDFNEDSYWGDFYKRTVERNENIMNGTDESRDFEIGLKAFKDNLIFGATSEELSKNYSHLTHETIWYFCAQNGIIGTLILYSPFLYVFFRSKKILDKKLLLLIALNLIQRPHYIVPLYLTIIYFSFFLKEKYYQAYNNTENI